jgi:hypothetical protein
VVEMGEEKKTTGKRALGKCSYCGSTRKALYEKRWSRWIVIAHYCPVCGKIEWLRDPTERASREIEEFWKKHKEEMEKACTRCDKKCDDCLYKKKFDETLQQMLEEKKKLNLM